MARWITLKESVLPFDYRWPDRVAITAFTLQKDAHGKAELEHKVKDEVADFIIAKGYGTEGKPKGSTVRSRKGRTSAPKAATTAVNATDPGPVARVDAADMAAPDSAGDRGGVDSAAG